MSNKNWDEMSEDEKRDAVNDGLRFVFILSAMAMLALFACLG